MQSLSLSIIIQSDRIVTFAFHKDRLGTTRTTLLDLILHRNRRCCFQEGGNTKKSKAVILLDNDSTEQHGSQSTQDEVSEVTVAAAPNNIPPALIVTPNKALQGDPRVNTYTPQSPELQKDPDHTSIGVEKETQTEPPVESLQV